MRGRTERVVEAVTHGRHVPVGSWRYDVGADAWSLSDACAQMLGLPAGADPTTAELFAYIHPDDRDTCGQIITDALAEERAFQVFYRIRTPRGQLSVMGLGEPVDDDPGHGPVMVGYLVDLTPMGRRRDLDQRFSAIVSEMDDELRTVDNATLMQQAHGLLMSVLNVDLAAADTLMSDGAERLNEDVRQVARHLVDHFERGAGLTRSMTQLRLEVDDVLQRD